MIPILSESDLPRLRIYALHPIRGPNFNDENSNWAAGRLFAAFSAAIDERVINNRLLYKRSCLYGFFGLTKLSFTLSNKRKTTCFLPKAQKFSCSQLSPML